MDNKRIIKTPIAALCYGIISSDNQRLFAIQDAESGHYVLPIFTDFEAAEIYRKHQNKTMMDETLPIKAMGGDSEDVLPEQLSLCVMDKPKKLQDMLDLVHIAVRMAFITINPTYGAGMMCYQMDELEIVE